MKLLMYFLISTLLCPAISFADELARLRATLDPFMYRIPGVTGSMIGGCIKGTDLDPSSNGQHAAKGLPIVPCLVYFVKTEELIPYVRSQYLKLRISSPLVVRFQKELPQMIEQ